MQVQAALAVLFADVVGSTKLYEQIGDVQAQRQINDCLRLMEAIVNRSGGAVVKTIGDELMCRFPTAEAAVQAACEIQRTLAEAGERGETALLVRIGLQYGDVLIENADVFGDNVNIAARMAGFAQAGQIVTTEQTVNVLPPEQQQLSRAFDKTAVKGKQGELVIYQIVWEQDLSVLTNMMQALPVEPEAAVQLHIKYRELEKTLSAASTSVTLGRHQQCDIVVYSSKTSRFHARLEYRRGKVVFIDSSTNGAYVRIGSNPDIYLHREELMLSGTGVISLGAPVDLDDPHLIYFRHSV